MSTESPLPSQSDRLLAALGYPICLVAFLILLTDVKKDPYMRHHGSLALFWSIGWLGLHFAWLVVARLPFLLWTLKLYPLLWPAWLGLSIYYAVQTYDGKTFSIPIVSDWARKYSRLL
ncbi:MAG: DUF4870 domain-containing protein [Bacillati bacterium ANGP1]|uniref:DUF4870 domain-containing protein n=1 Tax=Candidatus Segetimicrobium genomatis TaxID=2569760 RepID=A0A537JCT9_9BACT|nr:MAG: DUF4870 domain-containing protein [Terrabacteria group bacterium ANGP1]